MKIVLIFVAALLALALTLVGAGYGAIKLWPRIAAEFMPDIPVDAATRIRDAEGQLTQANDQYDRWVALGDAAMWKSTQANTDDAAALATELLAAAETYKSDWNYGNAIHKANLALGRIALRKGDRVAARNYLIASTKSKGSPQMNSFGPNMSLAKEMLEAGEKDAVLDYLKQCRAFWEMGHDSLDVWESMIRDGRSPRFGANLLY